MLIAERVANTQRMKGIESRCWVIGSGGNWLNWLTRIVTSLGGQRRNRVIWKCSVVVS